MFVFNRTPAYDNIVERMKKHEREEAAAAGKKGSNGSESPVKQNPITLRLRKVYKSATAGKGGDEERLESVDSNDSACKCLSTRIVVGVTGAADICSIRVWGQN